MQNLNIKSFMLLMFISGLLLLDILNLPWEYYRTTQALHIVGSIVFTVFILIPFIHLHLYEFMIVKKKRSSSGLILGFVLLLVIASGVYLFFIGNRGSDEYGNISFYTHMLGSFVLLAPLFFHRKKNVVALALLPLLFLISPSESIAQEVKLSNIKLADGASRYHKNDWTSSTKCKSCHSEIFNQWADSNHRHIAGTNPYYMVMENLAAQDKGENFREWCMGCHNPSAVTTQMTRTTHDMQGNNMPNFLFDSGSKDLKIGVLEQGVSCLTCHRIMETKSSGNSNYTLDLKNRKKYVFEDSTSDVKTYLSEKFINSKPDVHKQSYSKELYKDSKYCASCHDEFLPDSKKMIVSTYKEWEKSPFNNPKDKTKHKNCIDCHMTNLEDGKFSPLKGTSTDGGVVKKDVKVHYFSGSNHFLAGLKNKKNEDQTIQLLKTSAELSLEFKDGSLNVGVKNIGAGHHLPTGVSDFRELWLDITVKDSTGKLVYSSGKLKKDGNLGLDARPFMKVFGDENSKPVGLFFWRYKKLISDTRIPAGETRVESHKISDAKTLVYPLSVDVKLNFRIYPQWVTDTVKRAYPQLPSPPVITLEEIKKDIPLHK